MFITHWCTASATGLFTYMQVSLSDPTSLLVLTTIQSDYGFGRLCKDCQAFNNFFAFLHAEPIHIYSKPKISRCTQSDSFRSARCNAKKSFFLLFLRPQDGLSVRIKGREVTQGCDAYGKELTLKGLSAVSINHRGSVHILNHLPHKYTQTKAQKCCAQSFGPRRLPGC